MQRITSLNACLSLRRISRYAAVALGATVLLSACSPASNAVWETGQQIFSKNKPAALAEGTALLDPTFEYMLVTVMGRSFWATRVHVTDTTQGAHEVWLTPAHEILHTLNGRLTRTSGSAYAEWVQSSTAGNTRWHALAKRLQDGHTVQYSRTRDVEPGGFAGLKERITVASATASDMPNLLQGSSTDRLQWFEERSEWLDSAGRLAHFQGTADFENPLAQPLPPARFAVRLLDHGQEEVIYSEQCLSYKVCLTMQRWPLTRNAAAHR